MGKGLGIPRIGGKYKLIGMLVPMLEAIAEQEGCNLFADVCMGGQKIIANINHNLFRDGVIGNDWDPGLCSLASVFKSDEKLKILVTQMNGVLENIKKKEYTAEDFFNTSMKFLDEYAIDRANARERGDRENPKEMAAALCMLYTTYSPTYSNANVFHYGKFSDKFIKSRVHEKFDDYPAKYKHITFTNDDFMVLLDAFGHREDVLFYIDPPYTEEAMSTTGHYRKNTDNEAQNKMVDKLLSEDFKAKVVLSGWENDIYKRLERNEYVKYYIANVRVSTGAQAGKGTRAQKEHIWANVDIPTTYNGERILVSESKLEKEFEEIEEDILIKEEKIVEKKNRLLNLEKEKAKFANIEEKQKVKSKQACIKKEEVERKALEAILSKAKK